MSQLVSDIPAAHSIQRLRVTGQAGWQPEEQAWSLVALFLTG